MNLVKPNFQELQFLRFNNQIYFDQFYQKNIFFKSSYFNK